LSQNGFTNIIFHINIYEKDDSFVHLGASLWLLIG